MQDITEETTGERLTRALEAHSLTVRRLDSYHYDEHRLVVEVPGGAEIRIADACGQIDGWAHEHGGWVAFFLPHGRDDEEAGTRIYESEGGAMPPFEKDTAALVVAVVQCVTARSLTPA